MSPETWYLEPLDPPATDEEVRSARRVLRRELRRERETGRLLLNRPFFATGKPDGRLLRMFAVDGTPLLVVKPVTSRLEHDG